MCSKSLVSALLLATASFSVQSATVLYTSSADFNFALGGATTTLQDFESFAHADDLVGIDLLPGVSIDGSFLNIEAWNPLAEPNTTLFGYDGTTRSTGNGYYEISFSTGYNAFAFEITGYDPAAAINDQHGVLDIFTTTGNVSFDISQSGASESDPIFIGLVTDGSFLSIVWNEGPEAGGRGNEETGLDNLIVASIPPAIPVPAALPLMLSGGLMLGWLARRKSH